MTEFTHKRLTKDEHLDLATSWAKAWWQLDGADDVLNGDILPNDGVVTFRGDKPAGLSFLYDFLGAEVSLHTYLLTDPALDSETRGRVVQAHIPAAVARSETLGKKYQMWLSEHPKLLATLKEDHGFHPGFENLESVYRTSAGASRLSALET